MQARKHVVVEVDAILHLGPIVTDGHDGVIGTESSEKYDIDLGEKTGAVKDIRDGCKTAN